MCVCVYRASQVVLVVKIFVNKVMALLFNILSRLIIAFFPKSKCLLIYVWHIYYNYGLPWCLRQQRICSQCGRPRFDLWLGRSPGGGDDNTLQYSYLEYPHGQRSLMG